MALFDAFKDVPPSAIEVVSVLIGVIFKIIKAGVDDQAAHEEAMMEAQEAIKKYLDARKFGVTEG